jgi:hypothetical protein
MGGAQTNCTAGWAGETRFPAAHHVFDPKPFLRPLESLHTLYMLPAATKESTHPSISTCSARCIPPMTAAVDYAGWTQSRRLHARYTVRAIQRKHIPMTTATLPLRRLVHSFEASIEAPSRISLSTLNHPILASISQFPNTNHHVAITGPCLVRLHLGSRIIIDRAPASLPQTCLIQ